MLIIHICECFALVESMVSMPLEIHIDTIIVEQMSELYKESMLYGSNVYVYQVYFDIHVICFLWFILTMKFPS